MATKPQSINHEIAHFDSFKEHIPEFGSMCPNTIAILLKRGMMQVSTCFEHALANYNNTTVVNEDHCDISDGSDLRITVSCVSCGK